MRSLSASRLDPSPTTAQLAQESIWPTQRPQRTIHAVISPANSAGSGVLDALDCWSNWAGLYGAGVNREIPAPPGLSRVRRVGDWLELMYIGQTGRSLRERLGQLDGTYGTAMPYNDPHVAAFAT